MNFWELIGLPSKKRIKEQNRMISDLNEVVQEIKIQQKSIISLIAKNEEHVSESILLNRDVVNETKTKVNSLITDSENKNQELKELLLNLKVISNEIKKINDSNFSENIQNLNNMNTKSFIQIVGLIKELDNRIGSLEDNSIKPISKNLSLIKDNQEHISESILLNKEVADETETKVMSLLTDSENKNQVLKELLSRIEETGNGVLEITKSNLSESIQNSNNMNTKSFIQIGGLIKELDNRIDSLEDNSIKQISKNLSLIKDNQEHITKSIILNKEIANETKTKVISFSTDSENKNQLLKELLSKIEDIGDGVAKINESNLTESIQNLNNVNTKSFMQIYNLINELNICISDLGKYSINPISKNLSVIEETLRLMLVNDLIDDAEDAMKYLEDEKQIIK